LRALTAWHYGWAPAQEASGETWQAPLLSRLLEDPYSAVRYIAARSLKRYEGMQELDYDFLREPQHWKTSMEEALRIWSSKQQASNQLSHPTRVLYKSSSEFDEAVIRAMQAMRINRSMDLQE